MDSVSKKYPARIYPHCRALAWVGVAKIKERGKTLTRIGGNGERLEQVLASNSEIIRYDGQTLAVMRHVPIQIEACRGRRWGWFGHKGWWVQLHLFHGWHVKKFVFTLAEAGVFLKHDPDYLPWLEPKTQQD
ncbi:MAG: hypothetical protein ACRDHZ_02205 [Ktedonobacteraceae bacterium]